jgi:hypothetical protein
MRKVKEFSPLFGVGGENQMAKKRVAKKRVAKKRVTKKKAKKRCRC